MTISKLLHLKKFFFALCGIAIVTGASAAGWVDAVQNDPDARTTYLSGWACNPNNPGVSGWMHIYAGNQFMGALRADGIRGDLGAVCNGSFAHGFSGIVNHPNSLANQTRQNYQVWMALVMDDGSQNVDDIGNQPYISIGIAAWYPTTITVDNCSGGLPGAGWMITRYSRGPICNYSPSVLTTYSYLADPAAPIGAQLRVCSLYGLPNGWVNLGSYSPEYNCANPDILSDQGTVFTVKKVF